MSGYSFTPTPSPPPLGVGQTNLHGMPDERRILQPVLADEVGDVVRHDGVVMLVGVWGIAVIPQILEPGFLSSL